MNPDMEERLIDPTNMGQLTEKMTASKKAFLFLIAVLFAACVGMGSFSLFIAIPFGSWLQLIGLLALGTVYAVLSHRKFVEHIPPSHFVKAVYISLALFLAFGVVYFFHEKFDFLDVFALSCAFLLPSTIAESWLAFNSITKSEKDIWYYAKDVPAPSNIRYIENTKVKLKVFVDEAKAIDLVTSLPTTLELQLAIYYVIQSENPFNEGEGLFFKSNDQPYGWVFYTKKLFSKNYFIPDATIFENHIKPYTVIYAERVG